MDYVLKIDIQTIAAIHGADWSIVCLTFVHILSLYLLS